VFELTLSKFLRILSCALVTISIACVVAVKKRGEREAPQPPVDFVVVSINTGTTDRLKHDLGTPDGYSSDEANTSKHFYGNGLAWGAAIDAMQAYVRRVAPQIVFFQEIFDSVKCETIPEDARVGFVCEGWASNDQSVVRTVLGPGYSISCIPGRSDKCLAVDVAFGAIEGCPIGSICPTGLKGTPVPGCGGAARHGFALIELAGGGSIGVIGYHATSGAEPDDSECRIRQQRQIQRDFGALANGEEVARVLLGDFNTDPVRDIETDESARQLSEWIRESPLDFISDVGVEAIETYPGRGNIDHVLGDGIKGACRYPGIGGLPPVLEMTYFDHVPIECRVQLTDISGSRIRRAPR